jgi:hypothetical protein
LADFVTINTRRFFQKLKLDQNFLNEDPSNWNDQAGYQSARSLVQSIQVINDSAERGVALIQEYNRLMTRDEDQLQFLMQVVADHRRLFPDSKKSTQITG